MFKRQEHDPVTDAAAVQPLDQVVDPLQSRTTTATPHQPGTIPVRPDKNTPPENNRTQALSHVWRKSAESNSHDRQGDTTCCQRSEYPDGKGDEDSGLFELFDKLLVVRW